MTTTDLLTARPDDLAFDFYVWTSAVAKFALQPEVRTHPAARAKGKVVGACSYLGEQGTGGKTTTRAHVESMWANGIGWAPILEIGASDSDQGAAKGVNHARRAIRWMGQQFPDAPAGLTISGCSDTNTTAADLGANRDYHAAFADTLAAESPWRARCYGDYDTASVTRPGTLVTLPGAASWSPIWFRAVADIPRAERGNAAKMLGATRAAGLRDIAMLQQADTPTGALVDWLFIYTDRMQFWLPGATPKPPRRTLRFLSRGNDVAALQKFLGVQPANGFFWRRTLAAVKAFQRRNNLTVDGVVGPLTWAALERAGMP